MINTIINNETMLKHCHHSERISFKASSSSAVI